MNKLSLSYVSSCLLVFNSVLIGGAHAQTAATPNWTGFYVGAHIGNAISGSNWKDAGDAPIPVPFAGQFTGGGIVFGAQAGYNYQIGHLVLGVEGEGSFADIDGGAQCAFALAICDAKIKALGSLTGRLGYAADNFLFYGKAGGAWLYENATMAPNPGAGESDTWQGKQFRPGLAFGAGVEYAFSPAASARLEYNYLNFSSDRVDLTGLSGNRINVGLDQDIHLIKMGLNYKLSGAPLRSSPHAPFTKAPSATSTPQIWNGFYVGVHTGGGFGNTDWKSATGGLAQIGNFGFPGSGTTDGMIAGGQIGFNRQFGSVVVGGEIDASWANLDGFSKCATSIDDLGNSSNFNCRSGIDALGTFAGRLGWAHDNFLIYAKAGAAWAKENDRAERADVGASFRGKSVRWGYMLGSGVEYAFSPAWSGKVEYNLLNFGTNTTQLGSTFDGTSDVGIGQRAHIFKMGVNYRLGADPVAAAFTPPQDASDWRIDVGARYWYSSGSIQKDLYDPSVTSQLNSRLIYGGMEGHSAEAFARLDHRSGVFVKGNFGLGSLVNGKLNDEDFGPANATYSNTEHQVEDSSLRYGSIDVGKILISGNGSELGAYAGYRYFYQRGRGFGCTQVGADKDLCGTPIPANMLGLTETEQWRGAAVGLNARLALSERWKLEVDAAYLPYADHATVDNHWHRADINPAPAQGHGWGTQFEAILSYAVTDRLNVGIGGRYWRFATDEAATRFPASPELSPLKYTSERYGGFLQASYKIGGPAARPVEVAEAPPAHWTGLYVGGHLGAGFGSSDWSDPFPAPPTGDRVTMGGALGGGQIGINYQIGKIVIGAEIAGSMSHLEGSDSCFGGFQPATFAGLNCENTIRGLGMLTARLGYATGQNLFYVKGGGALARENYALNSNTMPEGSISSVRATNLGWTVGAGVEHALSSRWSINAEYKYLDLGKHAMDFTVPDMISAVSSEPIHTRQQLVTLGVNYRFSE